MAAKRGAPGGPSAEDKDLWRHVTRDAEPLKKRPPPRPAPTPRPAPAPTAPATAAKDEPPTRLKATRLRPAASTAPAPPAPPPEPTLAPGTVAGLDRRSAERLRRGKLAIEATLDLHGHTQAQAQRELAGFLARAQGAGKRCVLVVTGKGTTKEAGGVLRAQVPRWLNEPGNRARILAFAHAQPQHGGHGALYVLLRRARGD